MKQGRLDGRWGNKVLFDESKKVPFTKKALDKYGQVPGKPRVDATATASNSSGLSKFVAEPRRFRGHLIPA